ncbi:MAG: CSLREA domain-containing protein [Acidimicrobiia bacterium]|nr:CSLREA domain-containing protein [Acidimicrobiia bacterium]
MGEAVITPKMGSRVGFVGRLGGWCLLVVGASLLLSACHGGPHTEFVVDSTADIGDASPGDGECATTTAGECTLRAAVEEANALVGTATTIVLDPVETYHVDPLPPVTGEVSILGMDANIMFPRLEGPAPPSDQDPGFDVTTGKLTLRSLTIWGGAPAVAVDSSTKVLDSTLTYDTEREAYATGPAGIHQTGGELTVVRSTITNRPVAAVLIEGGSTTIAGSTIHHNQIPSGSGAIRQLAGDAHILLSTIADHVFTQDVWACHINCFWVEWNLEGNGIQHEGGSMRITASTLTQNEHAISSTGGLVLESSVVAMNARSDACEGTPPTSMGYNAVDVPSCVDGSVVGDLPDTNPGLGPLADNGGPTLTHLPGADCVPRRRHPHRRRPLRGRQPRRPALALTTGFGGL